MRVELIKADSDYELLSEINKFIKSNPRYVLKSVTVVPGSIKDNYCGWLEIE